jgi:hypothetical protein
MTMTMKRLGIFGAAFATALLVASVSHAQTAPATGNGKPVTVGPNFVDSDGDGICDNCTGTGQGTQARRGKSGTGGKGGYGPGNGTGNQGVGPRDGSGFGPGTGGCDGTGPKGQQRGRRGGGR